MLQFWFNTNFVQGDEMVLHKSELDGAVNVRRHGHGHDGHQLLGPDERVVVGNLGPKKFGRPWDL